MAWACGAAAGFALMIAARVSWPVRGKGGIDWADCGGALVCDGGWVTPAWPGRPAAEVLLGAGAGSGDGDGAGCWTGGGYGGLLLPVGHQCGDGPRCLPGGVIEGGDQEGARRHGGVAPTDGGMVPVEGGGPADGGWPAEGGGPPLGGGGQVVCGPGGPEAGPDGEPEPDGELDGEPDAGPDGEPDPDGPDAGLVADEVEVGVALADGVAVAVGVAVEVGVAVKVEVAPPDGAGVDGGGATDGGGVEVWARVGVAVAADGGAGWWAGLAE